MSKPKNIIKVSDIKFRKKWGGVNPATQIHKSDIRKLRSQEKLAWKSDWEDVEEELDEYDMDGC